MEKSKKMVSEEEIRNDHRKEDHIELTPEQDQEGMRLDRFLAESLPDHSRSYLQQLIRNGAVSVNRKAVKASYQAKHGDFICLEIPETVRPEILPEKIPLDIVYEDTDLLVVNKPQGMVVHPAAGHTTGTLVNALMYHCGDSLSSINGIQRPGIVHRIDKDTSGLLVICKSDRAHRGLALQFADHTIRRVYTAICCGRVREAGTVDAPLGRDPKDRKRISIRPDGRHAVTHYEPVEALKQDHTLIRCRLETGRTHQIRVHMASLHHPILGDPVYGPKKCPFHLEGQLLHAGTLGFIHPVTGEAMEFTSELPEHFQKILRHLQEISQA